MLDFDKPLPKSVLMVVKAPNGAVLTIEQKELFNQTCRTPTYDKKCEIVGVFTVSHREDN